MATGRVARLIERLLDQADRAAETGRWDEVVELCERVLTVDGDNSDAQALLHMAGVSGRGRTKGSEPAERGERRIVTVLFADAVGFTSMSSVLDEEDVYRVVQRCIAVMSAAVDRHSGLVTQFRGDGIMALFGAPIAQDRAEVAATAAALEMQAELATVAEELGRELGVHPEFRVGLNTGGVVVGSVSDDLSMDFTALGDTVNLAARMEQIAAPGAVFLTDRTYRSIVGYIECEDLGARRVKGKAAEVHSFRAVRVLETPGRVEAESLSGLSGFVGRDVEIELLAGLCERAAKGRSQAVQISADAGIGKSRLVYELQRLPRLEHLRWCVCHCGPERQSSPFGVLADLVHQLVEDGVPPILSDSDRPFVELLLGIGGGSEGAATVLDPRDRHNRTVEAAISVVRARCDDGPVVAVVEDAHWIDDASGSNLGRLVERLADRPFALLITTRPGYETVLGGQRHTTRLMLEALDAAEMTELVTARAGSALSADGIAAVCDRSEGNPFFAEELVKSALELGPDAEADREPGEVPDTVHEVILARIDRLPVASRRILQVASVVGREIDKVLLERLVDGAVPMEALDVLADAELLVPSGVDPDEQLVFKHALICDVAYSSLLRSARRELHAAVVRHLVDLAGGDTAGLASVLASHHERAEDWASAAGALIVAADRAAETGAVEAGLDLLARAIAAADRAGDDGQASAAAQRRAGLGIITGRFELAGAEWARLEGLARARGDDALRVIALAQIGVIALFAHDRDAADTATSTAVELLGGVQDPDASATAIGARFWFAIVAGHLDELDELRRAFEQRGLGASAEAQATWRTTQSLYSRWTGSFDQALVLTEHDAGSIRTGGRTAALARKGWIRVMALVEAGRFEDALEFGLRVLGDTEQLGEMLWRARLLNTLGWLHHEMLDPSAALEWNERSLALALELAAPDAEVICNAHLNLVENHLALGRDADATSQLVPVRGVIEHPGPRDWFMLWRYTLRYLEIAGRVALRDGDVEAAAGLARRCLEQATVTESRKYVVKANRLWARALLARGDADDARAAITSSVADSRSLGGPGQIWRSLVVAADVHDALGERETARQMLDEARAQLGTLTASLREPRRSTMARSLVVLHEDESIGRDAGGGGALPRLAGFI